jgi:glyoxylase-like metal-dependent hydrolase (beta-lactamase superfamily II)
VKTRTYPFNVGESQGFVLYDQASDHSAEELIVDPKVEELAQITHEYDFEVNEIRVGYNNLFLRIGDRNVLVDAGIRRPIGELCSGLEELIIDPADIDTIIITHSDRDHIGGILNEQGEIAFLNARYVLLEDSWGYWSTQQRRTELTRLNKWTKDKTQFIWATFSKIKDLILLVKPGEEFVPGLRLFAALGHRYDHSILKVTSSGEQLIHIADALAHPLFMGNRDWVSTYDADPTQAVATKIEILDMCASENALVFGPHFPFPGLGYVQQGYECWKWKPLEKRGP